MFRKQSAVRPATASVAAAGPDDALFHNALSHFLYSSNANASASFNQMLEDENVRLLTRNGLTKHFKELALNNVRNAWKTVERNASDSSEVPFEEVRSLMVCTRGHTNVSAEDVLYMVLFISEVGFKRFNGQKVSKSNVEKLVEELVSTNVAKLWPNLDKANKGGVSYMDWLKCYGESKTTGPSYVEQVVSGRMQVSSGFRKSVVDPTRSAQPAGAGSPGGSNLKEVAAATSPAAAAAGRPTPPSGRPSYSAPAVKPPPPSTKPASPSVTRRHSEVTNKLAAAFEAVDQTASPQIMPRKSSSVVVKSPQSGPRPSPPPPPAESPVSKPPAVPDNSAELKQLKEKVASLEQISKAKDEKVASLEQISKAKEEHLQSFRAKVNTLENELIAKQGEVASVRSIEQQLREKDAELSVVQERLQEQQAKLQEQQERAGQLQSDLKAATEAKTSSDKRLAALEKDASAAAHALEDNMNLQEEFNKLSVESAAKDEKLKAMPLMEVKLAEQSEELTKMYEKLARLAEQSVDSEFFAERNKQISDEIGDYEAQIVAHEDRVRQLAADLEDRDRQLALAVEAAAEASSKAEVLAQREQEAGGRAAEERAQHQAALRAALDAQDSKLREEAQLSQERATEAAARSAELEAHLEEARVHIAELSAKMEAQYAGVSGVQEQLKAAEESLTERERAYTELLASCAASEQQLSEATAALASKGGQLEEARTLVDDLDSAVEQRDAALLATQLDKEKLEDGLKALEEQLRQKERKIEELERDKWKSFVSKEEFEQLKVQLEGLVRRMEAEHDHQGMQAERLSRIKLQVAGLAEKVEDGDLLGRAIHNIGKSVLLSERDKQLAAIDAAVLAQLDHDHPVLLRARADLIGSSLRSSREALAGRHGDSPGGTGGEVAPIEVGLGGQSMGTPWHEKPPSAVDAEATSSNGGVSVGASEAKAIGSDIAATPASAGGVDGGEPGTEGAATVEDSGISNSEEKKQYAWLSVPRLRTPKSHRHLPANSPSTIGRRLHFDAKMKRRKALV